MIPSPTPVGNRGRTPPKRPRIAVLRPGALGDVVALRGQLDYVRRHLPGYDVALSAPGERGRLFADAGWVDMWLDWDSSALSWLFGEDDRPPSPALTDLLSGSEIILAFLGCSAAAEEAARLQALAPRAHIDLLPAGPARGAGISVYRWLVEPVARWWRDRFGSEPPPPADLDARPRMTSDLWTRYSRPPEGTYAVVHPGSGSGRKNWGTENFLAVCENLAARIGDDGSPLFERVVVTSGEADGELGETLSSRLPGSSLVRRPPLRELAGLLAGAALYLGNDSGVSHLAAGVATAAGSRPRTVTVFGPTDSAVWRPPGALALEAGESMDRLNPDDASERIAAFLSTRSTPSSPVKKFF